MRKDLSAPGLIRAIYKKFQKVPDSRTFIRPNTFTLSDCLMSCFAMFSLKWPSLLQYEVEKKKPAVLQNLQDLYQVKNPPSDTYMRERLDNILPHLLRPAFKVVFSLAQRGKILEAFEFIEGHYLLSIDGTGHYSSTKVHCANCCVKNHYDGSHTYYHNMMGGAIVHPDKKEVIPFCPEPITQQDGTRKNDCEQIASKRQLSSLRQEHPHLKIIVLQDALGDCGPNIKHIQSLNMKFIIVCKRRIFEHVAPSKIFHFKTQDESGTFHHYQFVNGIGLNNSYPDLKVNFFEQVSVLPNGKKKIKSWVTDIYITEENICKLTKGGRSRWKIENETFNTLKNQGYHFEHNFGHGNQHLCSVMCYLMLLAFLVDQLQLIACNSFQAAKQVSHTFYALWEKMRVLFGLTNLDSWERFYGIMSGQLFLNTS